MTQVDDEQRQHDKSDGKHDSRREAMRPEANNHSNHLCYRGVRQHEVIVESVRALADYLARRLKGAPFVTLYHAYNTHHNVHCSHRTFAPSMKKPHQNKVIILPSL